MPADANRIHTITPHEARDEEEVFRALVACKGVIDFRVVHDVTRAALDRLATAGRIRPQPARRLADVRVEIVTPALHAQYAPRRDQWDVRDGRRIVSSWDTRASAIEEIEKTHAPAPAQRRSK